MFCGGSRDSFCWTAEGFPTVCEKDPQGLLQFADRPQDAPVVHFGGPPPVGIRRAADLPSRPAGTRGAGSPLLRQHRHHGLGNGTFAYFLWAKGVPRDIRVTAEIEFPPKVPGGPAVNTRWVLLRGG